MRVTVNGEIMEVEAGLSLLSLLERIGKPATQVAVEHNGDVLDRAQMAAAMLGEHDRLEIVHFVGGG